MIFGILGKFPIGIGNQIFFIESFFRRKKFKTILVEKKSWLKNIFWVDFLDRFYVVGTGPDQPPRRKSSKNHGNPSQIIKNDVFFTNFVWTVLHHYLELGAGIWTGAKRDSEFSFYDFFFIEQKSVGNKFWPKKNRSKKNSVEFFWSTKFLVGKIFGWVFFFDRKKSTQKIFFKQLFFLRPKWFWFFFRREKTFNEKIWLPIPMGNFPKIPKITLRTACEHFKK